MALEAGGFAEKLGNYFETNWIAYQFIRLLEEKIAYVTVEPIGTDEVGVDVIIGRLDGKTEHHQCKAGNGSNEFWTLSALNSSSILKNAKFQIEQGTEEFNLVSPLTCKLMSDLRSIALNYNGIPQDFLTYQINSSAERQKDFSQLCTYLGLDIQQDSHLERAINFLQKFAVTSYSEDSYQRNELIDKASILFFDHPINVINFLKTYPVGFNKLRQKITTSQLLNDLETYGFTLKIIPNDERITTVIRQLSEEFVNSIEPHLITHNVIPRPEINEIIESVNEKAITLIKAEAGMGKSVLLLNLHQQLQTQNIISIPIRLDRKHPENNIDQFGQDLGFPSSPISCLKNFSKNQKVVIILDQLDAIRWTGSHSSNALEICRQLVRQLLSLRQEKIQISIILASRDFDIQEDAALSSWISSLTSHLNEISISKLDESIVSNLIKNYEVYSSLTEEKKKTLQIPLWLNIYLTIAERIRSAPQFTNKLELVRLFRENRLELLEYSHHITKQDAIKLIDIIVEQMSRNSRLNVNENTLPSGSQNTLHALISVGLLSKQNTRISFRHQALYDYQIGLKLFNEAITSSENLIQMLGNRSEQTLTKREHLKYALNLLLETDQTLFCNSIRAIIFNENIRFHLKYLALNSLKNIKDLKKPAKQLIDAIISEPNLFIKFLNNSCYENVTILSYLSEKKYLNDWLNSQNPELLDITLRLLRSIADYSPNLVLSEITPFIGKSEQWNRYVYNTLCWDIANDSAEMFEVRKQLILSGCYVNFINWKELSRKSPLKALHLIELMLDHYKDIIEIDYYSKERTNKPKFSNKDNWSSIELDEIITLADIIPQETLRRLLDHLCSLLSSDNNEEQHYQWLSKNNRYNNNPIASLINGIIKLLEKSAEKLSDQSNLLFELIHNYRGNQNLVFNHVFARIIIHLSVDYSDFVIEWLLSNPEVRFKCGNTYKEPAWILSGKIIEIFSPACSENLFHELENKILFFSSFDYEEVKIQFRYRNQGYFLHYWGETQYFLLPKLDKRRLSIESEQMIQVLNRKFSNCKPSDFCKLYEMSSGWVTSPIREPNQLSDKAWTDLILKPATQFNSFRLKRVNGDTLAESSINQFSNELSTATKNQPIRFCQLALALPHNIDNQYIEAFFKGLRDSSLTNVSEQYRDDWQPAPIELIEQVLAHFSMLDDGNALIDLLASRINILSPKYIEQIESLAINAKDPISGELKVYNPQKGNDPKVISAEELRGTTINCVRGKAYSVIADLFWENEQYALDHKHFVDSAISDPHPAVNMAALELMTPFLNYDEDFAFTRFLTLCNKDMRMTCGYESNHFFNNGFTTKYQKDLISLVLNMLSSEYQDVRKEAARQIYARWYFYDLFQDELKIIFNDTGILKEGCTSVVKQLLCDKHGDENLEKLQSSFHILVNDNDEDTLRSISTTVGRNAFWNKTNSAELFEIFVHSKAAHFNLYGLFHYFESKSESYTEYSSSLLTLVINITTNSTINNGFKNGSFQDSEIIKVVQRLYDEATDDEDSETLNICLDIWDYLFQSDTYSSLVLRTSNHIENGLLS